jgi:hypothetical protein
MRILYQYILVFFFCWLTKSSGQVFYLYQDSPNLLSFIDFVTWDDTVDDVFPLDSGRKSFFYFHYFKSRLPDGLYYYFEYDMKDSVAIQSRPEDFYLIKAEYKDSSRHGVYQECHEFYEKRFLIKRKKRIAVSEIHFKNGQLHGDFLLYDLNGVLEEKGFFVDGQRHGFFLDYDKYGRLLQIALYENGTFKYHSQYGHPTVISNCPEPPPSGLRPPMTSSDCR